MPLHPGFISVYLLLIMGHLQVVLESSENLLALLKPILCPWGPVVSKHHVRKGKCIIPIKCSERGPTDGHVISCVVAELPEV